MNRITSAGILIGSVILLAAAFCGCSGPGNIQAASAQSHAEAKQRNPEIVLACAGRVEGRSETINVGAAADGVISSVYVHEGQTVSKGSRLADLGCADLEAGLKAAEAKAESARQARARVLRGSREEERQMAAERTAAARAVLDRAQLNLHRMTALFQKSEISRSAFDDARRDHSVAEANLREAVRHEQLVNAPPLPEEVARLDAEVEAAESNVRTVREKIGKCSVVAPIDGTIIAVQARPGESFSTITPRPLFKIADLSRERVRAEVDERDVLRVRVGQRVVMFVEGQQDRKFSGSVARLANYIGGKQILSRDPSERADRDVLEALIDIQDNAPVLPVGMRVIVQFLP